MKTNRTYNNLFRPINTAIVRPTTSDNRSHSHNPAANTIIRPTTALFHHANLADRTLLRRRRPTLLPENGAKCVRRSAIKHNSDVHRTPISPRRNANTNFSLHQEQDYRHGVPLPIARERPHQHHDPMRAPIAVYPRPSPPRLESRRRTGTTQSPPSISVARDRALISTTSLRNQVLNTALTLTHVRGIDRNAIRIGRDLLLSRNHPHPGPVGLNPNLNRLALLLMSPSQLRPPPPRQTLLRTRIVSVTHIDAIRLRRESIAPYQMGAHPGHRIT